MTNIEWTDRTWNPTRGCARVSPGCVNCYAERQAIRHAGKGDHYEGLVKSVNGHPTWTGRLRMVPTRYEEPLKWKKPSMVFVDSMSDLFHKDVPRMVLDRLFEVMAVAAWHKFQILTKRARRMREYLTNTPPPCWTPEPPKNIWLGVSCEDQERADERIPELLATPAAVRFVSYEPALGPLDFNALADAVDTSYNLNALSGLRECPFGATVTRFTGTKLDWVIVGGESGPGARQFDMGWVESVLKQCRAAKVPCFVKQMGANVVGPHPNSVNQTTWSFTDRKGGTPAEWPEHLRVREWPQ